MFVDLFNLTRILADYRDDVGSQEEKNREEELQDKAVLYNEVLEVIRTLYKVSREAQEEKRYAKIRNLEQFYDPVFQIAKENYEDGTKRISFKIEKDLILNSWIEYRPKTNQQAEMQSNKKRILYF